MNKNQSLQSKNWTERWWFSYIIGGVIIGIWIVDIIFLASSIRTHIWNTFTTFLTKQTGWQFIILLALLIFREQLGIFLVSIGNVLGRIRKLKVGENLAFSSEELASALVDREVLKISIRVAMAYDGIGRDEQIYLLNRASPMKNHVQNLDNAEKWQVIEEAVNIALMDNEIQNPEYLVIQEVAVKLYGLESHQVDELIMKECFGRKDAIPPKLLKQQYKDKYEKLK